MSYTKTKDVNKVFSKKIISKFSSDQKALFLEETSITYGKSILSLNHLDSTRLVYEHVPDGCSERLFRKMLLKNISDSEAVCLGSGFIANLAFLKSLKKEIILDDPPKKISVDEINSNAARDFLFNHISKNVSGWVSKNINSKISIPISKILVKMNFHPNWITFFVGCIGISCGFFYASNSPIVAAIILQLSTILDRCDGEVARIRLKESKFGQWFDTALDQISYFSILLFSNYSNN